MLNLPIEKIKTKTALLLAISTALILFAVPSAVYAAPDESDGTRKKKTTSQSSDKPPTVTEKQVQQQLKSNPIVKDINTIVNFLSAGVGIIVAIVIIVGGIQYSMAGDNAQAVSAAKQRIINGLIALLAFLFMFAFLQWLVPGGAFS